MGCCSKKTRGSSGLPVIGQSSTPVKSDSGRVIASKNKYIMDRKNICVKCEHMKNGDCQKIAENNGEYRANIMHGIRRKSLSCPVGKWKALHVECMGCGRVTTIDEKGNRCKQCVQKKSVLTGNVGLGRDSVRHLSFYFSCDTESAILYHLERLDREIETFNGKKVCYFSVPDEALRKKYLPQIHTRFDKVVKNGGLCSLFSEFENGSNKDLICFANTIRISSNPEVNNLLTGVLYDTVFHNWKDVDKAMRRGSSCVGSFKNISNNRHGWSFMGGFFWIRVSHLLNNKKWIKGAGLDFDKYLGEHITTESSHCVFGDWYDISSTLDDKILEDISLDFKKWNNNSRTN
jgi:hypothetical protein